ncbi:MAG: S41 family peptidase [Lachnospiraceae bacterium]|nr:S41 family peptidase [Lachnospiraceae bacterium]
MKKHLGFTAGLISGLLVACLVLGVYTGIRVINDSAGVASGGGYSESAGVLSGNVIKKINYLNSLIDERYLKYSDDLKSTDISEGMYKGILESLGDQFSEYYTPEEYSSLKTSLSGSFEGIGAAISQNKVTEEFVVNSLTEDSPAEKAGVQVGDIFNKVDGETVSGYSLEELVSHVRGEKGTVVEIEFLRGEDREPITIDITRDSIESKTVSVNMIDDETGYMIIASFDSVTEKQFDKGLNELKSRHIKKLIIDLRGNLGGNVDVCAHIADALLPEGTIVYTKDKNGKENEWKSDAKCLGVPMVVLVDSNSASASEILAGAIKDYGVGTLVGTTTYGKGIVQDVLPLTDGSAVKLTTRKYYTPSGNNIQGTGIEPDVTVEFDAESYINDHYDNQLEKAKEIIKDMQ